MAAGDCLLQGDVNSEQTAFLKLDCELQLALLLGQHRAGAVQLPSGCPCFEGFTNSRCAGWRDFR